MTVLEQAHEQMRALVPVLEREIAELVPVEYATRGLASIRRTLRGRP
jgi:hypothetical protein